MRCENCNYELQVGDYYLETEHGDFCESCYMTYFKIIVEENEKKVMSKEETEADDINDEIKLGLR